MENAPKPAPEAAALVEALGRVVRRPDAGAIAATQAALSALRSALGDAPPRSANCSLCGEAPDSGYSLGTAANPDSLPAACYRIIPKELLQQSRCYEEIRCPKCGMGYVYERGYEFLVGGSEDEEDFTRLHIPVLLGRIEAHLKVAGKYGSSDLQDDLSLLESALRLA